jgi:epoxyqueuosine reductase
MTPEDQIRTHALELGFDDCRIARADEPWSAGARLAAFVEAGCHGDMDWFEETLERRQAPTAYVAGGQVRCHGRDDLRAWS